MIPSSTPAPGCPFYGKYSSEQLHFTWNSGSTGLLLWTVRKWEKNLDLNHFSGVASGKSGNVTSVNDSAASTKEAVDKEGQSTEGKKEDSVYKVQTARLYHIAEAFLKTIREFE